jgi:hypothetical protein
MTPPLKPSSAFLICLLLVSGALTVSSQQPKYGVSLKVAKASALASAKTYAWIAGQPSFDKAVDAQIKAAVDRELGARGFTKVESGASDVLATYASVSRTDVNLKSKAKDGARPTYSVGTLVVDLLDPRSRQPAFRVRVDTPINAEPAKLEAEINAAVAAMFQKYPARTTAK